MQHLEGAIEELLENGRPVRGVLSWVNADSPDAKHFSVLGLLSGTTASTSASMVNPMGRVVEIPIGLGHVGSGGNDGLRDVVEAVRRIAGRLERAAGATFPTTPEGGVNVVTRFDLSIDEPL